MREITLFVEDHAHYEFLNALINAWPASMARSSGSTGATCAGATTP